mmetsp:Transcript_8080/g.20752  ORF Transcript_8080/g.20752 Transcript_8080/m.20752 type:complete len:577 (+) Transcript_8080:361-2091(+)
MALQRLGDCGRPWPFVRNAPCLAAATLVAAILVVLTPSDASRLIPGEPHSVFPSSTHSGSVDVPLYSATRERWSEHYYAALAAQRLGRPGGEEPQSDAYEDPARLRALRQAFADEFDPAGRVRAMSKYRAARAQCTWTSTAAGDRLPHQKWKCRHADRLVFDTCDLRADSLDQEGNSWRIVRLGPFTSYGGDTNHFNTLDIGDFSEELAQGSPLWLTGHSLQILSADETPLPSPPMHLHHAVLRPCSSLNVTQEIRDGVAREEWHQKNTLNFKAWAGDAQCQDAEGGMDCFMETSPDGFGNPVAPRHGCLALDSMILDFRPKGSEVMEFYIELGFRWTRKAQVSLRLIDIFRSGATIYGTYPLSEQSTTMNWGAYHVPHSGRPVHMHIHAHREFYHSTLVFAASPEQLGLVGGSGPLDLSNWGRAEEPLELEKVGYSIGEAQAYLLKNLAKSQRACSFHGNCSNTPQLMCAFMEQGREQPVQEAQGHMNGIEWDRYGERVEDCTSVFLHRGDVITQVMFHRRAEDRERNLAHFKFKMLFLEAGNHDAEDINAMHMSAPLKHAGDRIIGPWSFSIIK